MLKPLSSKGDDKGGRIADKVLLAIAILFCAGLAVGAVAALLALVLGTGIVKLPKLGANYAKTSDAAAPAAAADSVVSEDVPEAYGEALPPVYQESVASVTEAAPGFAEETAAPETPMEEAAEAPMENLPDSAEAADGDSIGNELETGGTGDNGGGMMVTIVDPEEKDLDIPRRAVGSLLTDDEDLDFCVQLCVGNTTPTLIITGPGESFPTLLKILAPDLGALLDRDEAERKEDRLVFTTDFDTAAALAEWMELILPKDAAGEDPSLEQLLEYDPENDCLKDLTEIPEGDMLLLMREIFSALFGSENSWSLLYPDSDFVPSGNDTAYIVLIPS